jgi:hypothetical protein
MTGYGLGALVGRAMADFGVGAEWRVLAWLVEREIGVGAGDVCDRCGHGSFTHRSDDSTNVSPVDPHAEFRCVWPMTVDSAPVVHLCACPDFVAAPGAA